jgi:hypothetical protein
MSKLKIFFPSTLILISLILILFSEKPSITAIQVQAQDVGSYKVVFTIPISEDGIHYAGAGIPEMLTWGPAAFTTALDGSFWIADTAGDRLLHYDESGAQISKIDLKNVIISPTDIAVGKSGIWVLDQASMPSKVIRLTEVGDTLNVYNLPPDLQIENGLSGIALGDKGELLVEREGDTYITQITNTDGNLIEAITSNGYTHEGSIYSAQADGINSSTPKHGTIIAGKLSINVETKFDQGGMQILGFNPGDDFYVSVEEVALSQDTGLQIDQTVRHYNADGTFLGIARVPIAEQYTYVQHGLAVGADGTVFALLTLPDRAEIIQLVFTQTLDPILHEIPSISIPTENPDMNNGIETCVSRDTMINSAAGYVNNIKVLSSTNTDGSCTGRQKPRYLGGAGTYYSVPYDWNGFDTVSGFNSFMSPNTYQAGDINTSDESCSKGVDCSGYVSRTWQLATKKGHVILKVYPPNWQTRLICFEGIFITNATSTLCFFQVLAQMECGDMNLQHTFPMIV